jgi:hypothetical protein
MGFSLTGLLMTVVILLPNLFVVFLPPKNMQSKLKDAGTFVTVIERIGQIGCFLLPVFSKGYIESADFNIWLIIALVCAALYYGLWIRYAIKRDVALLLTPLAFIPIPMAVFPVLAFAAAAVWIQSIWLGVASVVLAIGHFANSWVSYKSLKAKA